MNQYRVTIYERIEKSFVLTAPDWNTAINLGLQLREAGIMPDDLSVSIRGINAEEQDFAVPLPHPPLEIDLTA